jgi:hypothetical protein
MDATQRWRRAKTSVFFHLVKKKKKVYFNTQVLQNGGIHLYVSFGANQSFN